MTYTRWTSSNVDPGVRFRRRGRQAGAGFPVTVEHRYGRTKIPAAPERVVTVGFTDQDYLLDEVVPAMSAAVDGDPDTNVELGDT